MWENHQKGVKPHLEVNGRRRIFRFYPDNTWLHFWRRTEIILPHLIKGKRSTPRRSRCNTWIILNKRSTPGEVPVPYRDKHKRPLTFMRWSTRASSWVLMDSLQYSLSPGWATSRMANSLWNINTAHLSQKKTPMSWSFPGSTNVTVDTYLKKGRCNRSLKTNGDEICRVKKSRVWNTFREWYWIDCSAAWRTQVFTWYGKLATHTSKNGRVVFSTSPTNIWSLACMGLLENAMPFN